MHACPTYFQVQLGAGELQAGRPLHDVCAAGGGGEEPRLDDDGAADAAGHAARPQGRHDGLRGRRSRVRAARRPESGKMLIYLSLDAEFN